MTQTYGFSYRNPGWAVTRNGHIVHSESSLLAAENWVTRGGADTYEQGNTCSTMGVSDTPADAGGPGAAQTTPDLAEPGLEVRHD